MPRLLPIEYAGTIYHVLSRGDRRKAILLDEVGPPGFPHDAGRNLPENRYWRLRLGIRKTLNSHLYERRKTNEAARSLGNSMGDPSHGNKLPLDAGEAAQMNHPFQMLRCDPVGSQTCL